jgi:phytoene dehydrogenase-like protein
LHHYDSIIIGAGHNGLVCASYLARKGHRVLMVEAADAIGGLAASREFHPGFRTSIAQSVSHFSHKVIADLELHDHGLSLGPPLPTIGLDRGGNHVRIENGALHGASRDDVRRYPDYNRLMQRFAGALKPFWLKTIPRVTKGSLRDAMTFAHIGLNVRRLGRDDMREFMRIATLPTRDFMDENFDTELLKAVLSWDGLIGSKLSPRSPNHAVLTLLYRLSGEFSRRIPADGLPGLIEALGSAATANGVEIRTGATVDRIAVDANADGLVASGVHLSDGEKISAGRVVSSADPQRTFTNLVGVENLEIQFSDRIRRLRCDGQVAKLHLALSGLPEIPGLHDLNGRMIIAPDMEAIEFAFDEAKYGGCSKSPVMEVMVPSLHDASFAPSGQHVLSAHVMYVPNQLKGGWNEGARAAVRERAIDTIAAYAPSLREHILHAELLTPKDIEAEYRVTGGHWHHCEMAIDQMLMMRPTYQAAQYRTPVPGLFLCGAGCHPGGDITGVPGHNAAAEILK